MINWLRPPQIKNEYERVGYYALHYTLQIMFIMCLVVFFMDKSYTYIPLAIGVLGIVLVSYILLHNHYLKSAAAVFIVCLWLGITLVIVMFNGIYNSTATLYMIVIIFVNILFHRRNLVYFVTALTVFVITVMMIAESNGALPIYQVKPIIIGRYFGLMVVLISTGVLLSFTSQALRQSLLYLQESEKSLQMRNQALEIMTKELLISEERYRLLFDNSSVMATVYNRNGQILFANQSTADFHGRPRKELEHLSVNDLFFPGDAERVLKQHEDAFLAGEPIIVEGHSVMPTGREVDYLRHAIPLPRSNDLDDEDQMLVLTTDLTEQRRAQKRKEELKAAQEKIQFFTEFFGTVSHDIKTPLAIMETSIYLLQRLKDEDRKQEKINQIYQQIKVLEAYIQDMLLISRLDHAPQLERKLVDINMLIFDVMKVLQPKCEQKGINCLFDRPPDAWMLSVDEGQIHRMLMNLIENAVNYTSDGEVEVIIHRETDGMLITIRDTGIGIPEDDIPHIFEPFYRSLEAKRVLDSGTGLGLAIVKKIVDLHRGNITVESQPQQGTKFQLRLPTP